MTLYSRAENSRKNLGPLNLPPGGGGESVYEMGWGCSSSRLGVKISDFGLAWGFLGKPPLYLAVKVS